MSTNTENFNDTIDVPDDPKISFADTAGDEGKPDAAAPVAVTSASDAGKPGVDDAAATQAADAPITTGDAAAAPAADGQQQPQLSETDEQRQQRREKKRATLKERVRTLTRERHEAAETAAAARARAELVEEENRKLREQLNSTTTTTLTEREQAAIARRDKAAEEHDLKSFAEATDELTRIQIARELPAPAPSAPVPTTIQQPAADEMHPSAAAWLAKNQWFTKAENTDLAAEVLRLQHKFQREGKMLGDDFYRAIDEELALRHEFDEVRGIPEDDAPPPPPPLQEQQPVAPAAKPAPRLPGMPQARETTPPPPVQRPGALTEHDKATMRRFGLNPHDAKHRDNYIKHKAK